MKISPSLLRLTVAPLLLLALSSAKPIGDEDVWYVVSFSGTPVGIVKDSWRTTGEGVFYENYLKVTVSRLGTQMAMIARTEELDGQDGIPLRFRHEVIVGGTRMLTVGERAGDSLSVSSEGQGFSDQKTLVWENDAVGQGAVDRLVRRRLTEGEREFSIRTFDPQFAAFRATRYRVTGEKRDVIRGHEDTYVILEQFEDGADHPAMTSWLDGDLEVRRVALKQMGMEIMFERVTADVIAGLELDPDFDVIRESMIACEGCPDDPSGVSDVEFRIEFSRPIENVAEFNGPNQKVLAVDGATVTLLVARDVLNKERATEEQTSRYLKPDRYIQSGHPLIKAVADSIAASLPAGSVAGRDEAFVTAAARWVSVHISKKGFGQGFASAVDVLDSREGDCTEHAVLLAAVLRAGGVPARTAVGLVYSGESFMGHMWTEAYLGFWRTADALDPDNDPVRIRIAVSPDERALDEADVANAYSLVGGVAIEVLRYRLLDPE